VRFCDDGDRAVGALTDVTERRSRERELERQNERLDRFAAVVSHDLRNPLAVAEGYLQLARETGEPEHFDRAADALTRIEELTDDLLDLARSGRGIGEVAPVLLSGVTTEAWENVAAENARLRVTEDDTIEADRSRLCQLFGNLFRNAVEHGRPDERTELLVSVGLLESGDGFYVEDDGTGIPEDVADRPFETGVTGSEDGTGFGLAIVEEVAASHGWEVTATEADGGGARFEITGVTFD
jgi:signal transduction histidine kinase